MSNRYVRTGVIAIVWAVAGALTTLFEYFFLANYPGVLETGPMEEYNLTKNLITAVGSMFVGGLVFGLIDMTYFQKKPGRQSFRTALFKKVLVHTILLVIILSLFSFFYNSVLSSRSIFDDAVLRDTRDFIASRAFWHPVLPFILMAIFSSFMLQLSERFGTNELWHIFTGKYFHPKEEQRIFMFLDLNQSTSIAEKIGNAKFHSFLNDFFHDIAKVILRHKGEVVEYVGDMIIISWTFPLGTAEARCLKCFEEMENEIRWKQETYMTRYKVVPQFKAAVHCGDVMIGEMGKIKKSIKYSGDVLNTTARVEKLCNSIGAKLAITDKLAAIIPDSPYDLQKVEDLHLEGKEEHVDVFKVVV